MKTTKTPGIRTMMFGDICYPSLPPSYEVYIYYQDGGEESRFFGLLELFQHYKQYFSEEEQRELETLFNRLPVAFQTTLDNRMSFFHQRHESMKPDESSVCRASASSSPDGLK